MYCLLRPCRGRGGGGEFLVARRNFKASRVGVYKCLSLIVGFAVNVAIWQREVVSCHDFILRAVATFWAIVLVGIYPGRASLLLSPVQNVNMILKIFTSAQVCFMHHSTVAGNSLKMMDKPLTPSPWTTLGDMLPIWTNLKWTTPAEV